MWSLMILGGGSLVMPMLMALDLLWSSTMISLLADTDICLLSLDREAASLPLQGGDSVEIVLAIKPRHYFTPKLFCF